MYKLARTNYNDIQDLRTAYLRAISAPLDGMWENAFFPMAKHWRIRREDEPIGYVAVNDSGAMLGFDVGKNVSHASAFAYCIEALNIKSAFVSTAEPAYLSLCADHQKSLRVNALMYSDIGAPDTDSSLPTGVVFRPAEAGELGVAVTFGVEAIGADRDWLTGYFEERLGLKELFGLWRGEDLLATGELRLSPNQESIADVGMIVGQAHRRQGLATAILCQLRDNGRGRGLKLICSTTSENIGAKKAIERAGFASRHRILEFQFSAD